MPHRRRISLFLPALFATILSGPAVADGPVRQLGPEGYMGPVSDLRFLSAQDLVA